MTDDEFEEAKAMSHQVQVGDLVLVKTPNVFYEAMRKLYRANYDHIVVVFDSKYSLHISYPKARLVETHTFTLAKRDPLVIRPRWRDTKQRDEFLHNLR